jgi:hypothetical protein
MKRLIAIGVVASALLSACTAARGPINAPPPLTSPSDAATIIVARENRVIRFAVVWAVALDGVEVFGLGRGEHAVIPVNPGEHVISIHYRDWTGREEVTHATQLARGQTRYFRVDPNPNSGRPSINPLTEEAGKALVAATKAAGSP